MTHRSFAARIAGSLAGPAAALLLATLSPAAHAWWSADWTMRTRVTLDTSAKGEPTQEAVSAALVPVRLHSGNFDFAAAKEDGSDLRVVAADDKTPLKFSIERYDGINELAVLWVQLPSVLPGTDKNLIHVYAGNPKAAAEPAVNVVPADTLALRFSEADGPAIDASGAIRSEQPVLREVNGLLAGSLRLAGQPVVWPAGEKLRVAAGGALTLALWIKPDNPSQGTLLDWGPLKATLKDGAVQLALGSAQVAGGSLPPAAWAHVVLAMAGGKAAIYVNGAKAAEGDAALPAIDAPLAVGAGLAGQLDELQVISGARSADWIRLAAASQGSGSKLVASVQESAGESDAGGSEHGYMGILVKNLTVDAWVVIIILGLMFLVAAWVMVVKTLMIGRTDRDNRNFLQRFRGATGDLLLLDKGAVHPHSSLFRLYQAGVRELRKRNVGTDEQVSHAALSGASLDAVKASVDADLVRENHKLNAQMVFLTIAISGGPFLGLLGTVVGVMITFAAIAAAGDVNVNAIAPGIAAALLATVAGLGVAIPALFAYNWLASRIKNISADMQIFVDEFVTRVAETYGQR
jgi:biopolymer transport protein ExbB